MQALLWFKSPPRYFARCTRRAAAEQVAALDTFMQELNRTLSMGVRYANRGSGASAEFIWPSYRSPAAADLAPVAGKTRIQAMPALDHLALYAERPANPGHHPKHYRPYNCVMVVSSPAGGYQQQPSLASTGVSKLYWLQAPKQQQHHRQAGPTQCGERQRQTLPSTSACCSTCVGRS